MTRDTWWHFRPYRLQLGVLMWAWLDIRARDLYLKPIVTPAVLPPLPLVFG